MNKEFKIDLKYLKKKTPKDIVLFNEINLTKNK
jgi:hypothetical protein